MNSKGSKEKKFKIEEILNSLSRVEYAKVIKLIPGIIGKSVNTFNGYARITVSSKTEIPYNIVVKLEILFGLPPNGLCNIVITGSHYKELI
ncbi:MAG TPA: hypothetical protein VK541_05860 [Pedobacter sp.]|uniref:hypothetical protein n=1 Tax=Pedobacter sp. TaxID=1411316 RepID=UPI002BEF76E5|nr:hypothetical protein [Pedobacter sp.]HMI01986.1 hypothetical protein [Pedobacter sp.]